MRKQLKRTALLLSPFLIGILLMGGCALRQEGAVCGSGEGEIHGTPLQEVMCALRYAVYEDEHRNELERDDLRQRYALNLAERVATLSEEIAKAPETMPGIRLEEEDARAYALYTRALKAQGERIRVIAEEHRLEQLDRAVETMIDICNRCHAHFQLPLL